MATRKSGNHHQLIHTVLYLPLFTRLLSHHPKKRWWFSRSINVRKQPENPTLNDQQQWRTQLKGGGKRYHSNPGQYTRSVCIISPWKAGGVSKSSCKTCCFMIHPLKPRSMELNYKETGVWDKYPVPMQYQVCKCGRQVNRTPRKTIWQQFSWSLWPGYRLQIFRFSLAEPRNISPRSPSFAWFFVSPSGTTCGVLDTSLGVSCFLLVDFVLDLKLVWWWASWSINLSIYQHQQLLQHCQCCKYTKYSIPSETNVNTRHRIKDQSFIWSYLPLQGTNPYPTRKGKGKSLTRKWFFHVIC